MFIIYRIMRKFIIGIFLLSLIGTGIELLLLDHVEGIWQATPLIIMLVSLPILLWHIISPSPLSKIVLRSVMGVCILSGILGIFLHYKGNSEFELEMYPSMAGWELFWKVIKGATPVLAPGTMIGLGLLGWTLTLSTPTEGSEPPHIAETKSLSSES